MKDYAFTPPEMPQAISKWQGLIEGAVMAFALMAILVGALALADVL